ncbi:MAG: homoserine dehydrogenase [Cyclobacteriaceae bacterium]
MKKRIGLFGFGCVAQGFYAGLQQNPEIDAEIVRICVKNPDKERLAPSDLFTTEAADIIASQVDILVELIDDAKAAKRIVVEGLKAGIPVISANKKMIAENLRELVQLQQETQTPFLYEGAVAGSIPILYNLDQFFSTQSISAIRGILNGSTNYILTKMKLNEIGYEDALDEAQALGFAESDPALDVEGTDAAYKTAILGFHAFGQFVDPASIEKEGIDKLTANQILDSRKENHKLKLVCSIDLHNDQLSASVKPELVSESDALYAVDYEYNAISVNGNLSGIQTYVGKGAGSHPTGSAVLSDLNLLLSGFSYNYLSKVEVPIL